VGKFSSSCQQKRGAKQSLGSIFEMIAAAWNQKRANFLGGTAAVPSGSSKSSYMTARIGEGATPTLCCTIVRELW